MRRVIDEDGIEYMHSVSNTTMKSVSSWRHVKSYVKGIVK